MKKTIFITKTLLSNLWNVSGYKDDNPSDIPIQILRLWIYLYSLINEDNNSNIVLSPYTIWKNAYSYFDNNGKQKTLINYTKFLTFIKTSNSILWKYNVTTNKIHINLDNVLFYINWDNKRKWKKEHKNEEYIDSPALRIKFDEWEIMKSSSINELKLYFYILYEKIRGPFNFIQTDINELQKRLLFSYKEKKQLKRMVSNHLTSLKEKGIIYDFQFSKYKLTIQKRYIKPTK